MKNDLLRTGSSPKGLASAILPSMHFPACFRVALLTVSLFALAAMGYAQPAFEPFDIAEINLTITDYASWKKGFDADSVNRKASGMSLIAIGRELETPNQISLVFALSDLAKAKAFVADPRLKELMESNGVLGKPEISFYKVMRINPETGGENPWVVIKSKVTSYDAWLQVFDGEGAAKRKTEGSNDIAIGQGIEDPSLLYLVFDIEDMAKFKASMGSEEKKKIMTSAGVVGPPTIKFYSAGE